MTELTNERLLDDEHSSSKVLLLTTEKGIERLLKKIDFNHLCKRKRCVNPLHLEAVTHHANVLHGDAGKNMRDKTHCPQGHPYNDENTNHHKTIKRRTCRVCNRDRMRVYRATGLYNGRVYLKKADYE